MSAFSDLLVELDALAPNTVLFFERDMRKPPASQWVAWVTGVAEKDDVHQAMGHSPAGEGALHDLVSKLKAAKAEAEPPSPEPAA